MKQSDTPTPAELRARAQEALTAPGRKRLKAVEAQKQAEAELRPLVVAAVRNEVPFRRIQALTGISPNTARAWAVADTKGEQ
jgi:hypothetical protein